MSYLNDIGPKGRLFCQGTHSLPCANKQRVRCNFNYLKIEIFIKKLTRNIIKKYNNRYYIIITI